MFCGWGGQNAPHGEIIIKHRPAGAQLAEIIVDAHLNPDPHVSVILPIFCIARTLKKFAQGECPSGLLVEPATQLVGDPIVKFEKIWDYPELPQDSATRDELSEERRCSTTTTLA